MTGEYEEFKGVGLKGVGSGWVKGEVVRWCGNVSFLEEVKPETGLLVKGDRTFDLKGRILVFNGGSGSTVGSYNIYNLRIYDKAPAAMIMEKADAIITIGCIMADIPLVHKLGDSAMEMIETGMTAEVNSEAGMVRLHRKDQSDSTV
ncbi:MAG: aconitase X swivel domain-containing protein [Thermoplasmatota archaeon]